MKTLLLVSFVAFSLPTTPSTQTSLPLEFVNLGRSRLIIVRIPAGKFRMGTSQVFTAGGNWSNDVERPVHQVTISQDFWMGQFSVTQRQWQEVMGNNPSYFKDAGSNAPVEQVDWNQVQAFLAKADTVQSQWSVRLPTEAEWEYAARAGTTGETFGPLDEIAGTARTVRARLTLWG